jgi:hypothetical protein
MRATRPLFWFYGGTPPTTPRQGACAPWTPFCPPPWAEGSPAFWVPLVAGLLMRATRSLFWFYGGTPPTTPRQGACAPLDPRLPTPVGLGFASVLGPTRGGVANAGYSPPLLVLWGDTPTPPAMGASPPWTPVFPTPVGLGFASVLGVNLSGEPRQISPFPRREGGRGLGQKRHAPWTTLPTLVGGLAAVGYLPSGGMYPD